MRDNLRLLCILAAALSAASGGLQAQTPAAVAATARADAAAQARALAGQGRIDEALERLDRALQAAPNDASLRFLRGVVLMDAGRDPAALATFTALSQEYPDLPDPFNNVALLQVRAGQPELALQALQEALRSSSTHRTALANLGHVHLMLAARAWEGLVSSGPVDGALQRRLEALRILLAPAADVARVVVPAAADASVVTGRDR